MEGRPEILADNRLGVIGHVEFLVDKPFETSPIRTDKVDELFELVIADAGATLPYRDSVDLRAVHDVRMATPPIATASSIRKCKSADGRS